MDKQNPFAKAQKDRGKKETILCLLTAVNSVVFSSITVADLYCGFTLVSKSR